MPLAQIPSSAPSTALCAIKHRQHRLPDKPLCLTCFLSSFRRAISAALSSLLMPAKLGTGLDSGLATLSEDATDSRAGRFGDDRPDEGVGAALLVNVAFERWGRSEEVEGLGSSRFQRSRAGSVLDAPASMLPHGSSSVRTQNKLRAVVSLRDSRTVHSNRLHAKRRHDPEPEVLSRRGPCHGMPIRSALERAPVLLVRVHIH